MEVFVTRRIPQAGLTRLAEVGPVRVSEHDRPLSAEEIVEGAAGCQVLVSMLSDPLHAELLAKLPDLKLIAQYAVGFNNIDLDWAREHGLAVTNTPGVLTEATADLTLALILALTRRLGEGERLLRGSRFDGWAPEYLLGMGLQGKVLGICGMGRIGQAVARRALAFDLEVVYNSHTPKPEIEAELPVRFLPFEEMLAASDIVSIHAPLTTETYHLFRRATLHLMKKGAYLINTARGPIVKEIDLVEALEDGHLGGAGLDVYEAEPQVESRLLAMEQVVLLPHIGSATVETRDRMAHLVADNVLAFSQGRPLPNLVV